MRRSALLLVIATLAGAAWWWRHDWQTNTPAAPDAAVDVTAVMQRPRTMDIALIQAAFRADEKGVIELLKSGASPRARYGEGGREYFKYIGAEDWTALLALSHSETTTDRVLIAKLLLDAGADINADDGYGDTALAQCCYLNHDSSHESLGLFLLDRGANTNTRTGVYIDGADGITPLHRAVNNPRLLRSLIQHHAELNVVDSEGRSPLNWASLYKDKDSIQILLEAGADDDIAMREGKYGSSRSVKLIEMLPPAQHPIDRLRPVVDYLKGRREVLAAWILSSIDVPDKGDKNYIIYLLQAAKNPQELKESVTVFCDGEGPKFTVSLLDPSRWAQFDLMRSGVPFYAAPGFKVPTAKEQK